MSQDVTVHPSGGPGRVVGLACGGTIASRRRADGALGDHLPGEALAASVDAAASVEVRDVFAIDSAAMTSAHLDTLRRAVSDALADPSVAGVVVTHGTDTLEESAFLLDLMHYDPRPVVVTGAQQPSDAPDPDGPTNLAAAIALAVSPGARGQGVLVAFGGRVLRARGLRKRNTVTLDAFACDLPPGGRRVLPPVDLGDTRVDLIALYPGVDAGVVDWSVGRGAAGIVLAATGSANTHRGVLEAARRAMAAGVAVVATTRVVAGPVEALYGGGGGGADLAAAGVIIARELRGPQARIALTALLASGADGAAIAEFFG